MKPLRFFMVVALLIVPLLASDALADFTAGYAEVIFARVGATSVNKPIIGFTIPCASPANSDTLKTLALKSYIERAHSVKTLKLWKESNGQQGWQSGDSHLKTYPLNGDLFQTQDTIVFTSINNIIRTCGANDRDTFWVTVDCHTDYVNADPYFYHGHGIEVLIEPGYIHLGLTSGEVNTNRITNPGYNPGDPPDEPPYFDAYKLVFDTQGPPFNMMWCFALDGCKTDTIDLLDSLCIQADTSAFSSPGDAIKGNITLDLSPFGFSSTFPLKPGGWDSCFVIPDKKITNCIDVDSGHVIYATAKDTADNVSTIPLYFNKPIDTCKPCFDSITFRICYDQNSDGTAAVGDSLEIITWAFCNADFEVDSMIANLQAYFPSSPVADQWEMLIDTTNNNRLFRLKFKLTEQPVEMTADSSENRITVWAWDNACNYDTLQKKLKAPVDLQKPFFVNCYYYWHWDIDTFVCIGIDDSVLIGADLTGSTDLASVTSNLVEAGIYGADNQDLYDDGNLPVHGDATADDAIYNLLWKVGEPPIEDGKDTNNTYPPTIDYNYTVLIKATDDAGNWDTCRTPRLNRILDTRRPRWTNPSKMYIKQMPDAKIAIYWPTHQSTPGNSCNEKDARFFYVYVDSGSGYGATPIGATFNTEYKADTNMWLSEKLTDGKYYKFKIKQEDDCGNFSDFSKEMGALADGTPPHVCIAVPDPGLVFGVPFPVKAVADSESHDVDGACLWYRLRRDLEDPLLPPGQWTKCGSCMDQPGDGWVFTDTMSCIVGMGYRGWVELIILACDIVGNCQDTVMAYDDACLVDGDIFQAGHFLFYWDTLAPGVYVTGVNGFPSPQTSCGYDVVLGDTNWLVIDVDGAEVGELFEVEVTALGTGWEHRIFHQDSCAMPLSIPFFVDGWPEGSQNIYVYVKDYDNDKTGNAQVQVCVPPGPPPSCIYLAWPHEWMRIPCTGTSGYNCVELEARLYDHQQCDVLFTEVLFQYSDDHGETWYAIDDDISQQNGAWTTCWDNTGLVDHGDTVYLRVIARDEYYMADTSYMVKVFVDCEQPKVSMLIEELYYTCGDGIPKVPCSPLVLKAVVEDTLIDIDRIRFWVKKHSDPDIHEYWQEIDKGEPAWSDNIWMCLWEEPCCEEPDNAPFGGDDTQQEACMYPNDFWDIRVTAYDIAGQYMFDYDNDGKFDDSTFNDAVAANAGMTIFVDDDAPEPAISLVCDMGQEPSPICIVNPSSNLGGTDKAFVQAGNDIYVEVSPQPSEDTCEVMKVHYFLKIFGNWEHVGTSFDPYHFPLTFNPVADGLIRPAFVEDNGYWMGEMKAELYDSLGNMEEDRIDLYLLDATPTQAVIIEPLNDSYVSGDVTLKVAAINSAEICMVCYEYRPADCPYTDDTCWYPVNGGYPNACVYPDGGRGAGEAKIDYFELTWYTLNTIPDGEYFLRAVATDCDNNVDDSAHTIKVTVANELPTVVMDDPRICERTCPDNPEDTLGYISGTVMLYATASSTIPIEYVKFWYKDVYDPRTSFKEIKPYDYFPTDGKYAVEWNTGSLSDGRYQVKAEVHNAAGRWGQSDPITISVDNSAPYSAITAIMGEPVPPGNIDITLGDVIDIELVAIDSTSDDGWTRCYNSGLVGIEVCIENCIDTSEITKCFEVSPVYDGFHTVQWNTSGLEFEGCYGCYYLSVKAWDCLGNLGYSSSVTVYISDYNAPITTIAGFDGNYIYGYSSDGDVKTVLFEYADSGSVSSEWMPIGWSSEVSACCDYYLYKTSWDPSALENGTYQVRVISHDTCSNQDDDMAPIAYIHIYNGVLTPYSPLDFMGAMSFLKNWCVGGMHGIVLQDIQSGEPFMLARYINNSGYSYECVEMQEHLQNTNEFAGSFYATPITDGGSAEFFSSVTIQVSPPPMTGVDKVTYLSSDVFDVVKVKCDLGTHGTYLDGCVELTIPDGGIDCAGPSAEYVWVSPTYMEWAPVSQPDILPIGNDDGYATYISFTDCYYCCGWFSPYFGGEDAKAAGAGATDGYHRCCLNDGKYAIIKMCYKDVDVDAEHLAVAWWDCDDGEYRFDHIFYPATVEGFDTEDNTVEFATDCLRGPFVVIQLLERQCQGTISVNMLEAKPYCNGYTNSMPTFKALITDNVQGPDGIDKSSIQFKIDLYNSDQLIRIYNGAECGSCNEWMTGFGSFQGSGYDDVPGIFTAGWSDSNYAVVVDEEEDSWCDGCFRRYFYSSYWYWVCMPAQGLAAGNHMATVTAMNENIQTCTDTMEFMVDVIPPTVQFADSVGAYVGENPNFCIYFDDTQAGLDKSSIYIDLWGDETTSPDPNNHNHIGTITPAMLNWIDENTVCIDGTFEYSGGYLHVYVYGGSDCLCEECTTPQYYYYKCGIADCVGNHTNVFWRYFTVDADGPTISFVGDDYCDANLQFKITDDLSGLLSVEVFEDSSLVTGGGFWQDEHNPKYWWYSPATGVERVDVVATDNLGNETVYSFDLPTDCQGPTVKFGDQYVCKNPTIEFWVTDPAGVDWTTVNVYISGCSEECYYYAEDLEDYIDTETGKVSIDGCHLDCYDEEEVNVYVFSGTSYTGDGPWDVNGNYGKYRRCSFVVDAYAPSISKTSSSSLPIQISITDEKSGVDWSTLEFYEDGILICQGLDCMDEAISLDTASGILTYTPEAGGIEVEIRVTDKAGCNTKTYTFTTEEENLVFTDPHNYPNPFDPREGNTTIDLGLSKAAYVTAKIYDFAGEFVKELQNNQWTGASTVLYWNGTTDDGTEVGNGTYLCYLHAKDTNGGSKTAVIKITVLKENE